jgi:hypothetical protein
MMSKSISQTLADLRNKLGAAEGVKLELDAEIAEISFDAHTGVAKAATRLSEIARQQQTVAVEIKSQEAALAEGAKREVAAQESQRAELRRSNAAKAANLLLEAEETAALLSKAMADMSEYSSRLRDQFSEIRRLTGTGPTPESVQVNLGRSLTTAVMNSPMKIAHLAPNERCTVDAIVGGWATSVRNWINATLNKTAAQEAA